jgi:hypothetical protein
MIMNLKEAVSVAKQEVDALFADAPQGVRLEQFLYDDHLAVWSLTIGFALPDHGEALSFAETAASWRCYKIVRVSEADKTILSIRDR